MATTVQHHLRCWLCEAPVTIVDLDGVEAPDACDVFCILCEIEAEDES